MKIGGPSFANTEILIPTKNTYYTESTTIKKNGFIGGSFFEDSTIIIDYINGYLFIETPSKKAGLFYIKLKYYTKKSIIKYANRS